MLPAWELSAILVVGLAVGTLGAMMGIGGGILMVPFLSVVLQVPIHNAIAASLVAIIATSCAAAAVYLGSRLVNLRLGISLETASATGGMIGGLTAIALSRPLLTLVFALSLLAISLALWRRKEEEEPSVEEDWEEGELGSHFYDPQLRRQLRYRVHRLPLGFAVSLGAGFLSGLLGIGGGVVKVPIMVLGMGVPIKAAVATSNFMIGVTAVASAYIYYSHGYVEVLIATPAALGVFFGSLVGARWAPRLRSAVLGRALALLLAVSAMLMALRAMGLY